MNMEEGKTYKLEKNRLVPIKKKAVLAFNASTPGLTEEERRLEKNARKRVRKQRRAK